MCIGCTQNDFSSYLANPSLHNNSSFPLGTAVRFKPFQKDAQLRRLQQHHFDSYTAGSDMKMNQVMPVLGAREFHLQHL